MKLLFGLLLLGGTAFFASGCSIDVDRKHHDHHSHYESHKPGPPPWAPAHGYRAKTAYRYYEVPRCYYREDGAWIWFESGDWRIGSKLPSHYQLDFDRGYKVVEFEGNEPWAHKAKVSAGKPGNGKKGGPPAGRPGGPPGGKPGGPPFGR